MCVPSRYPAADRLRREKIDPWLIAMAAGAVCAAGLATYLVVEIYFYWDLL